MWLMLKVAPHVTKQFTLVSQHKFTWVTQPVFSILVSMHLISEPFKFQNDRGCQGCQLSLSTAESSFKEPLSGKLYL